MILPAMHPPYGNSPSPDARRALVAPVVVLLALLAGCASSGTARSGSGGAAGAETGEAALFIALHDYVGNRRFELANPGHTEAVEYYSKVREGATRKVVSGEIVAALIEYVEDHGLGEYASGGGLPRSGAGLTRGIEISGPGGSAHWVVRSGSSAEERQAMVDCTQTFLETYNLVTAFQTVENEEGSEFFDRNAAEARATGGGR